MNKKWYYRGYNEAKDSLIHPDRLLQETWMRIIDGCEAKLYKFDKMFELFQDYTKGCLDYYKDSGHYQ